MSEQPFKVEQEKPRIYNEIIEQLVRGAFANIAARNRQQIKNSLYMLERCLKPYLKKPFIEYKYDRKNFKSFEEWQDALMEVAMKVLNQEDGW